MTTSTADGQGNAAAARQASGQTASARDLVRVRASTDPAVESVIYWKGEVYGWQPGAGPHHLFGFEGLNVARGREVDAGWQLLTREAAAYLDPITRTVLDRWDNPFTGHTVDVQHVAHDPANITLRMPTVPMLRIGEHVVLTTDVLLAYPSPLPAAEFPENSADDTYRAMELFQLMCTSADLDSDAPSIPAALSWTRISPWLPWMAMGARPGGLVYHCAAIKLSSAQELPAALAQHAGPHYLHAPTDVDGPNQTSWTRFKAAERRTT